MISEPTRARLKAAINDPDTYCSGAKRKQLLATYDKLLDELSVRLFDEPCTNRMVFRQNVNSKCSNSPVITALKNILRKQELLFSKDYRDHSVEIKVFLTNDLAHFLKVLRNE